MAVGLFSDGQDYAWVFWLFAVEFVAATDIEPNLLGDPEPKNKPFKTPAKSLAHASCT